MTKVERTRYIEDLKTAFPKRDFSLTDRQLRLLSLIACADGSGLTEAEISKIIPYANSVQRDRDIASLQTEYHLIERAYFIGRRAYRVVDSAFMCVALNALLYFSELVDSLLRLRRLGESLRFRIVQRFADGDKAFFPDTFQWRTRDEKANMFKSVAFEPVFEPLLHGLRQDVLWIIGSDLLDDVFSENKVSTQSLDAIEAYARKYLTDEVLTLLLAEIDGARFFQDGQLRHATDGSVKLSEWPAASAAILTLYRGDYGKAVELFDAALKIRNKREDMKNIFESPVLAYFLILSYILSDTDKSRKKIAQYLNKKFDYSWIRWRQAPALLLANLTIGASDRYIEVLLREFSSIPEKTSSALVRGIAESRELSFPSETKAAPSQLAIVRHELGIGTPEEKSRFAELFGGTSLLSRIRVKKPWETALDNLSAMLDKSRGAASDGKAETQKDRRLIYLMDRYNDISIREQSRLKNGNWGQGKRVAYYSFGEGMYNEISDEYDRAVQSRAGWDNDFSVANLFPVLVGCDRVFFETYLSTNRIEICEEQPFVEVKLSGDSYVFKSNVVRAKYEREYALENVYKRDKYHYKVIRLNRIQSQILQKLSDSSVRFPEAAAEALKAFVTKLSSVIEVHSPLLETGSSLEEKQGNAMLHFRIIPKNGSFDALLYVRPLENGKLTFYPGKGESIFYDSDAEKRYQVKRDIKAERASLEMFLERTGLDAFDSEDGAYALAPEDMLPVLDACRGLGEICSLEWPEGRSLRVIGSVEPQKISINVRSKEQWFEVEGDVELSDGQSVTIEQIMSALSAGGYGNGYLKLGEDEYVALSDSLAKYLKRLESVTQSGRGGERISMFQTGVLADIVKKSHLNVRTDKAYQARLARIEESASLMPAVPGTLKAELRDYQEDGFRWMARLDHWGAGACLADDMGLGKTVQTIAFLLSKAAVGASLVVAPASVLMNWSRELARFAPSLNVIVLNEQDDRADALSVLGKYDIVLTTYGLLVREKDTLASVSWNVVCLDEAHTIKNRGTKMSDAAMALKASSRVILTGTPVQNYLGELWNLFQFLNPGLLGSYESFQRKFIAPIENSEDKDRQAQLKRIIQPFMLRRTKAEVVDELPEKTEIFRTVPMSAAETVAYETMRLEAKNELDADNKLNMNALAAITRLREAACAMSLVKNGWTEEPSKVAAVRELIGDIVSGGNSVLVFSQFTGFLDIVSAALEKDDIAHFYLQGSTSLKKRQEMVSEFQHGEKPVFLISLKAGGLGLNLTGANYVIHLDPWWNPAIEQQATDRAYRIGQQQNVTVYHLIAANTIEEKILRLHKTKQNLADAILEGTSKSHAITLDELRELLQ